MYALQLHFTQWLTLTCSRILVSCVIINFRPLQSFPISHVVNVGTALLHFFINPCLHVKLKQSNVHGCFDLLMQ